MKSLELKKSIARLLIEGSFANIEITDIFGIAASHIASEASAAIRRRISGQDVHHCRYPRPRR